MLFIRFLVQLNNFNKDYMPVNNYVILPKSGSALQRPTPSYIGQLYFDTTLGFPVWCYQISPAIWVNSSGVSV